MRTHELIPPGTNQVPTSKAETGASVQDLKGKHKGKMSMWSASLSQLMPYKATVTGRKQAHIQVLHRACDCCKTSVVARTEVRSAAAAET